jgi:cyanophycinase-like exopeptidase
MAVRPHSHLQEEGSWAEREKRMRKVLIAALVAAGVTLVGTSAGSALPANSMVVKQAQTLTTPTTNVWWRRHCHGYYSRWHWC